MIAVGRDGGSESISVTRDRGKHARGLLVVSRRHWSISLTALQQSQRDRPLQAGAIT
jgi:hypothetical protein